MEILIKNLGGFKALRLRIVFLLLAIFITSMPLVASEPQHIKVEKPVAEEVTTEEPTTEPEVEDINVSIALESVEKDIRIGFYDEDGKIIAGHEFSVVVKDVNGKEETYTDEDKDGFIVIRNVTPGDAVVTPSELPGCVFEKEEYSVKVKDHVEYKPIKNVVVKNDGADKKKVAESPKLVDTVKLIESKIEETVTYKTLQEANLTVNDPYPETTTEEETTEAEEPETTTTTEAPTTMPATTKLLDSTGKNQLFLKEGEDYREATFADYSEDAIFYVKEVTKTYFGWQNIDGKMYYFDENGKYVVGTQVIGGVQYNFSQTGVRGGTLGVDVSVYQGNINWAKAKAAGIDFAIIRLGFRGWGSNGSLNIDANFHKNLAGAKAAGIKVGVYFFSQAKTPVEAVEEASLCIKELGGQHLDLPVFIDTETAAGGQGRADNLSVAERTAVCVAFCNTIQNSGYRAGVYSNKHFYTSKLNTSQLLSYTIWLAEWPSDYTKESKPTYSGRYDIWQFSERGNGATYGMGSQYVDMNYS